MTLSILILYFFGLRYNCTFIRIFMYKLSFLVLLLTTPLLPSTPYAGLPLWAWVSLAMSTLYALILIIHIEKNWDETDG